MPFHDDIFLFQLNACILGFEHLKGLYASDKDFRELYATCHKHPKYDFLVYDGYLFKGTHLCIPKGGTRELLVREFHGGSLVGHDGENKKTSTA